MDKERIVHEDNDTIIYNKPAGVPVQSDRSFDVDLMSDIRTYLVRKGEKSSLFVINRLDRPVSGLVLFAKNKQAAAKYSKLLKDGGIGKEYYAVVRGVPSDSKGSFEDYLIADGRSNTAQIADSTQPGAKRALLLYETVSTKQCGQEKLSLIKIKLITGRHHQIRVQFASRKLVLLGDTKYAGVPGGDEPGFSRNEEAQRCTGTAKRGRGIALCSYKLEFMGRTYRITPEGIGFEYFTIT